MGSKLDQELVEHFDNCGFELSILVTKWFIPLFSNTIPFSLLFRIWDFIFIQGISGLFRIAVSLLLYFRKELLDCDLIQISDVLNAIGRKRLVKEKEVQMWFDIVLNLNEVVSVGWIEYRLLQRPTRPLFPSSISDVQSRLN